MLLSNSNANNTANKGDNVNFDQEYDYFYNFAENNGLYARFSMYGEGIQFEEEVPLRDREDRKMRYKNGDVEVVIPVVGKTWGDFYIAANSAIMLSGNLDHCYIEDFKILEGGDIELITGS